MTLSTSTPQESTFNDGAYVGWLLAAVKDPASRASLRRADISSAEHMAYPLLASRWAAQPGLRAPMLLHAASAARYDRVRQSDRQGIGHMARSLVQRKVIQESSVETRLLAIQLKPLDEAHKILGGLLAAAHSSGGFTLDWFALWRTYRYWNARPDAYPSRKQILSDFYAHSLTRPSTSEGPK